MKKFLVLALVVLGGAIAQADVVVPYGQWTNLPNCGGQTRLTCDGPRSANQCHIEFANSYGCNTIKMYVGSDFYPTYNTYQSSMQGSFWVDNAKVGGFWVPRFNVFLDQNNQGTSGLYERIQYQFAY